MSSQTLCAGLLCACALAALAADDAKPTPAQPRGPFYPQTLPAERDNDLAHVGGQTARGDTLLIKGRVLGNDGRPIKEARVEIWQADAGGRYHHPADRGGRADPAFQGWGETRTDASGNYEFRTVIPGAYSGRAPHVHFAVTAPGRKVFYTQMYFAAAPENAHDDLLQDLQSDEQTRLLVKPQKPKPDDPLTAAFDIVLPEE